MLSFLSDFGLENCLNGKNGSISIEHNLGVRILPLLGHTDQCQPFHVSQDVWPETPHTLHAHTPCTAQTLQTLSLSIPPLPSQGSLHLWAALPRRNLPYSMGLTQLPVISECGSWPLLQVTGWGPLGMTDSCMCQGWPLLVCLPRPLKFEAPQSKDLKNLVLKNHGSLRLENSHENSGNYSLSLDTLSHWGVTGPRDPQLPPCPLHSAQLISDQSFKTSLHPVCPKCHFPSLCAARGRLHPVA